MTPSTQSDVGITPITAGKQEKKLLTEREFKPLADIATQKQALIDAIQSNNEQKVALLKPYLNQQSDKTLVDALVQQFGIEQASHIKQLNQELESTLAKCQHLNAVNGQAIVRSLENNQELLAIITGKQNNNSELYNALGKVTSGTNSKLLGDA